MSRLLAVSSMVFSVNNQQTRGVLVLLKFCKNSVSASQILWSLCSVVFHALTLKLPIQTPHFVAPELSVSLSSHEKSPNFRKTRTPESVFFSD